MSSWLPWVRRRHTRLQATPLPPAWREIAARRVPLTTRLSDAEQATLEGLVQLFLDDKTFEGCGGLVLTDEIRVTIAAQACLLLIGLEVDDPYPDLDVIRVYPASVQIPRKERDGWVVIDGAIPHLGLSSRGFVVLTWDAARQGAADPSDGHNVVLHEFAHQLDSASGPSDGAPSMPSNLYRPWAKVLGHAYDQLLHDVHDARPNVLDPYGTTNPAEFFAVVTEAFFEQPAQLRGENPELYDVLVRYFRQDPVGR